MTAMMRRGTPSRRVIFVAASGSVGETTAPSTKAALHEKPSISSWATTATAHVVAITRPIASSEMARAFCRRSRNDVEYAE